MAKHKFKLGDMVTVRLPKNIKTNELWVQGLSRWDGKTANISYAFENIWHGNLYCLNRSRFWFRPQWLKKGAADAG